MQTSYTVMAVVFFFTYAFFARRNQGAAKQVSEEKSSATPKTSVEVAFQFPEHREFEPSRFITRRINEGAIHIRIQKGRAFPVLHVGSERLRKKLGVYRFKFENRAFEDGTNLELLADEIRDEIINFVKERLKKTASTSVSRSKAHATSEKMDQQSASLDVSEAAMPIDEASAEIDKKIVPAHSRNVNGATLIDFGYKLFPYTRKGEAPSEVFFAKFQLGSVTWEAWGSDLERAMKDCNASRGDVVNYKMLGRRPVENMRGRIVTKKLFEMEKVSS